MTAPAHSPIGPSGHEWPHCAGSVLLQAMFPQQESEEQREGTAAHELGELMLSSIKRGLRDWPKREECVGASATNGCVWDEEMYEAAELYATVIQADAGELRIEQRVTMPQIHPQWSYGTLDALRYGEGVLRIYDYKYGRREVPADSDQLKQYALGAMNLLGIDGYAEQSLQVELVIVQPRCYSREGPVRRHRVLASDLRGDWNRLSAAAHAAVNGGDCTTGDHCKDCTGRHACPAALQAGASLFEAAAKPVPHELSPHALGVQYALITRALRQLEYLQDAFGARIEATVREGQAVPGWAVNPSMGRLNWIKPQAEVYALGALFGVDLRQDKPVTPTQAKKLGIDEAVISQYAGKSQTGVKIEPDTTNKALKVFTL